MKSISVISTFSFISFISAGLKINISVFSVLSV